MADVNRRGFLATASTALAAAPIAVLAEPAGGAAGDRVLNLGPGTHLLLDDALVAEQDGLTRRVMTPRRHPEPVLSSARFGVTQPYLTVIDDPQLGLRRMWYNRGPQVWHTTSRDGVAWSDPRPAWPLERGYGASVVLNPDAQATSPRRFLAANWQATRDREDTPEDDGGMFVGFSGDGLAFTSHAGNPVLRTWPEGFGRMTSHGVGDTIDAFFDPVRGRYAAAVKVHALPEDGWAEAPKAGRAIRRLVGMTTSDDFLTWQRPWRIFSPDRNDEGLLEFYGMGGVHARGSHLIGWLRVLRDDLPCDEGGPVDGIGYTVLATSRDGRTWNRFREPLLDRDHDPDSWDHAMAWGSGWSAWGDALCLYYGGYRRGHKVEPESERQIGLAYLERDRYAAICPAGDRGRLLTRAFQCPACRLSFNVRAPRGQLRARVVAWAAGRPPAAIRGFDWGQTRAISGDHAAAEFAGERALAEIQGQPIQLEIELERAELFGFELVPV